MDLKMYFLSFAIVVMLMVEMRSCAFLNTFQAIDLIFDDRLSSLNDEFVLRDVASGDMNHYLGMQACKHEANRMKCVNRGKISFDENTWCENKNVADNTVFNIGSITKMFTIATLLRLVEDRPELFTDGLETKLSQYIPHLKATYPDYKFVHELPRSANFTQITLMNLIQHTSGISDFNFENMFLNNAYKLLNENEFLEGGLVNPELRYGHFYYSSLVYNLIGMIMKAITSMPFSDLVKKYVIRPLNLKQTFTVDDFDSRMEFKETSRYRIAKSYSYYNDSIYSTQNFNWDTSMAGLFSTPRDLVLFANEFFKEETSLLFNEKTRKLIKHAKAIDTERGDGRFFSLGFFIFPNGMKGHTGSDMGANALLVYNPLLNASAAIVLTSENLSNALASIVWSYENKKAIPANTNQPDFLATRFETVKLLRRDYSFKHLAKMRQIADKSSYLFWLLYTFETWKEQKSCEK